MLLALIYVLIVVVVGAICFYLIDDNGLCPDMGSGYGNPRLLRTPSATISASCCPVVIADDEAGRAAQPTRWR
jgi:hypothetical protein